MAAVVDTDDRRTRSKLDRKKLASVRAVAIKRVSFPTETHSRITILVCIHAPPTICYKILTVHLD